MTTINQAVLDALRRARRSGAVASIYLTTEHARQLRAELGQVWNWNLQRFEDVPLYPDKPYSVVFFENDRGMNFVSI